MSKKKLYIAGTLVFITALIAFVLPWKVYVERQITAYLQAQGIENAGLHIGHIGLREVELKDIRLGASGISIDSLTVGYTFEDLRRRRLGALHVHDVEIGAGKMRFHAGEGAYLADETGGEWSGQWQLQDVTAKGGLESVPPLAGEGQLKIEEGSAHIEGVLADRQDTYRGEFAFTYPGNILDIRSLHIPWQGGEIILRGETINLDDDKKHVTVHVRAIDLNSVLQAATGERASASGTVSGNVPLTLMQGGGIELGAGALTADGEGTISLSPDALPGDAEQMSLVRDVLKNFHYHHLSLTTGEMAEGKPSLLLQVEGSNPDVYDGREVKLNVRLLGDVLGFLQQNVMLMTDPSSTLRQDQ